MRRTTFLSPRVLGGLRDFLSPALPRPFAFVQLGFMGGSVDEAIGVASPEPTLGSRAGSQASDGHSSQGAAGVAGAGAAAAPAAATAALEHEEAETGSNTDISPSGSESGAVMTDRVDTQLSSMELRLRQAQTRLMSTQQRLRLMLKDNSALANENQALRTKIRSSADWSEQFTLAATQQVKGHSLARQSSPALSRQLGVVPSTEV